MMLILKLKNIKQTLFLAVLAGLLMTMGCGPMNARGLKMVPGQLVVATQHDGAVKLQVEGGRDEHIMGLPMIPNAEFLAALKTAIEGSNIFSQVVEKEGAEYRLEAFIFNLSQPMFINGDVKVEIAWIFSRAATGEILWQGAITTTGSGNIKDDGYNKRVATEQAANENIKQAIEHLSKISM